VNATIVLNLATLVISLTALVISMLLTLRQLRLVSGGIHLPVVLDAFKETRSAAWFEAQEYVLTELAKEHEPDCGHRGLPEQARAHANTIGLFYDDLGKLVAHGMIDQSLVIGAYGTNIVRLWDALAPYVYTERREHGLHDPGGSSQVAWRLGSGLRGLKQAECVHVECVGEGEHGEEAGFDGSSGFDGADGTDGDVGPLCQFLLAEGLLLAGRLQGRGQVASVIAISTGLATCPVRHTVTLLL
jgi:hypothetical protein